MAEKMWTSQYRIVGSGRLTSRTQERYNADNFEEPSRRRSDASCLVADATIEGDGFDQVKGKDWTTTSSPSSFDVIHPDTDFRRRRY
jgi:hypothetical protein